MLEKGTMPCCIANGVRPSTRPKCPNGICTERPELTMVELLEDTTQSTVDTNSNPGACILDRGVKFPLYTNILGADHSLYG